MLKAFNVILTLVVLLYFFHFGIKGKEKDLLWDAAVIIFAAVSEGMLSPPPTSRPLCDADDAAFVALFARLVEEKSGIALSGTRFIEPSWNERGPWCDGSPHRFPRSADVEVR